MKKLVVLFGMFLTCNVYAQVAQTKQISLRKTIVVAVPGIESDSSQIIRVEIAATTKQAVINFKKALNNYFSSSLLQPESFTSYRKSTKGKLDYQTIMQGKPIFYLGGNKSFPFVLKPLENTNIAVNYRP